MITVKEGLYNILIPVNDIIEIIPSDKIVKILNSYDNKIQANIDLSISINQYQVSAVSRPVINSIITNDGIIDPSKKLVIELNDIYYTIPDMNSYSNNNDYNTDEFLQSSIEDNEDTDLIISGSNKVPDLINSILEVYRERIIDK